MQIRFRVIVIDDVVYEAVPYCVWPGQLKATNIATTTATLNWSAPQGTAPAQEFRYYYSSSDAPPGAGVNGTPVQNTFDNISGLSPNTNYYFWVRSDCGDGIFSDWAGPKRFKTQCNAAAIPFIENFETGHQNNYSIGNCWTWQSITSPLYTWFVSNDAYIDAHSGDWAAYLYGTNEDDWVFYPLQLTAGQTYLLKFYAKRSTGTNGSETAFIKAAFGTTNNAAAMTNIVVEETAVSASQYQTYAGTFTPSTSGLYNLGINGRYENGPFLYLDDISVTVAPGCIETFNVEVNNITATTATVNWDASFSDLAYYGYYLTTQNPLKFVPGPTTEPTGYSEPAGTTNVELTGLTPNTIYYVYIKTFCGFAGGSSWSLVKGFTTAPACPAPMPVTVTVLGSSAVKVEWDADVWSPNPGNFALEYGSPFFTPGTGAGAGGGAIVNPASSPYIITGLAPNTYYSVYVRQSCTQTGNGYSSNSNPAYFKTLIQGDVPVDAIELTVNDVNCSNGFPYSHTGATASEEEPYPSCSGYIYRPIWFKFTAPANGAVQVSTDYSASPLLETKIALFAARNPSDYSSFEIISCDDDGGYLVGTGRLSVLYATGLTAGATYYIAVDRHWTVNPDNFCITVKELTIDMLSATNTCINEYQTPVHMLQSADGFTYKGWVPLLDVRSKLVALVRNPAGGSVADYTHGQSINNLPGIPEPVRKGEPIGYYLDRNYFIHNPGLAGNAEVQLFFTKNELSRLWEEDNTIDINNLGIVRQSGAACADDFDAGAGDIILLQSTTGIAEEVFWVNFTTSGFSNFYITKADIALPLQLISFKVRENNCAAILEWTTADEINVSHFDIEKSTDGVSFSSIATVNARNTSGENNYTLAVPAANGKTFFRLKMTDIDGTVKYSNIRLLTTRCGHVPQIYPNPVHTVITLKNTDAGNIAAIRIISADGRVVKEMAAVATQQYDIASLGNGYYFIQITGKDGQVHTLPFLKQ